MGDMRESLVYAVGVKTEKVHRILYQCCYYLIIMFNNSNVNFSKCNSKINFFGSQKNFRER